MLTGVFGYALHQEKATYGLGFKLLLPRKIDNSVLNKADATDNDKIKFNGLNGMCHLTPLVCNSKRQYVSRF